MFQRLSFAAAAAVMAFGAVMGGASSALASGATWERSTHSVGADQQGGTWESAPRAPVQYRLGATWE